MGSVKEIQRHGKIGISQAKVKNTSKAVHSQSKYSLQILYVVNQA